MAIRKTSKLTFRFWAVSGLLVLIAIAGWKACDEPSNIRACLTDLTAEVRKLISEKYGDHVIPSRSQFSSLESLRSRYGNLVPYYCQLDLDGDGLPDFVSLLFVSGKVVAVIGFAKPDSGYSLHEVSTGFAVRPDGENETYLLAAVSGRHYRWDQRPVDLTGTGFYFGTLHGPEYLLYWNGSAVERLLSRD